MPTWLGHVLASLFLHQDLVFLHYQEKMFSQRQKGAWLNEVFTPNPQDKMVITFRQWLEKRAGGTIPWAEGCNLELPSAESDKQKLFDVWTTHTQQCQVCQDALKNIHRISLLAYVISAVLFCFSIILDARNLAIQGENTSIFHVLPPTQFWLAITGSILFAIVGYFLKKFTRLFYVYEFEHAKNN
jgi:phenylpropionate dioxygenase-like ring-hydroxylating dioxygenase large terminal subunit